MCNPETLPENFSSVLNEYTSNGYRVIGLAQKKLDRKMKWVDAQRVKRDQLECDMAFLGFLVMQNSLKPETTQVIRELHEASMRLIMVTGLCSYLFQVYVNFQNSPTPSVEQCWRTLSFGNFSGYVGYLGGIFLRIGIKPVAVATL